MRTRILERQWTSIFTPGQQWLGYSVYFAPWWCPWRWRPLTRGIGGEPVEFPTLAGAMTAAQEVRDGVRLRDNSRVVYCDKASHA